MMILTRIEQRMVSEGISAFSTVDLNALIIAIGNALSMPYFDVTPDVILQRHKDILTDTFSDACEESILDGFTSSDGHAIRLNRDDQVNMIGQKMDLDSDPTVTIVPWRTEDAGYVNYSKSDWITIIFNGGFKFKQQTLLKYNNLKTQVTAVTPVNGDYATAHSSLLPLSWDTSSSSTSTTADSTVAAG